MWFLNICARCMRKITCEVYLSTPVTDWTVNETNSNEKKITYTFQ